MLLAGAQKKTANDLKKLLDLSDFTEDEILSMNKTYLQHVSSLNNSEVSIIAANKIYSHKELKLKEEFAKKLSTCYLSGIESVDFVKATSDINDWVAKHTKNKIKDIILPGSLNSASLVLINANYFKAPWSSKFKAWATKESDFHLSDGHTTQVDMMNMADRFEIKRNINGLKARTCHLPYKQHTVSMTIILPDEDATLAEVEESLETISLNSILFAEKEYKKVNLSLPKFKMQFKSEVNYSQ